MQIRYRILTYLLVLSFVFSINGNDVLAASGFGETEIELYSETIAETEAVDQDVKTEETELVDVKEQVAETELVDVKEQAVETELVTETELMEKTETVVETDVLKNELTKVKPETETETEGEKETEAAEHEVKGYAGMSLASYSEGEKKLRKAVSNTKGTARIRNSSYSRTNAIDISEFNIVTDWSKVKASGVQAVIVRVAGRYIGSGKLFDDDNFAVNVQKARKVGLQVGVYFFSQALNEKEAIEEADYAALKMAPYKSSITLPVFMDYEWDSSEYRLYNAGSIAKRTATVKAFMTEIKKKGYQAGLYASDNVLGNYLDSNSLSDICSIWIAHWGVSSPGVTYSGVYDCWQYTASGTVPGITGTVDLDYYYLPESDSPGTSENVSGKEGIYIISAVSDPGHALEITSDGNLILGNYTGNNNQKFIITSDSEGRYQITSFLNGKVFDCQSGGKIPGTNIWTYKRNNTIAQTWLLQKAGSEIFYVTAYNSGNKIMADSNRNIVLGNQDKNKKYEFILNKVSSDPVTEGWYEIPCASATSYVLDIRGASYVDKANCQIYKKNGTNAQKFYIERTSDGYYRILCAQSGKVLDVNAASKDDYANIQQYASNGTDAQKWIILLNDEGSFSIFSKKSVKSLSVENALFSNAINVSQLPYTRDEGQMFRLVIKKSDSGAPVSEGKYYIVSAGNTGYAAEVEGKKNTDSTNIRLNKKKGSSSQQFLFVYLGNGYYRIVNGNSGKAVDVKGGSMSDKANIQQYRVNGTDAQIWKIQKNVDGTFSLVNKRSLKCLDIAGAKYQENTNIWQYKHNGTKAQKFYLMQD